MPGLLDRARLALARRIAPRPRPAKQAAPPGGFSFGMGGYYGGPWYTDAFQARKAPTPWQLVENYKTLIFALIARNRDAVTRIPLRLYADGSRAQGRPGRACDPIRVARSVGRQMARANMVSTSAVDQVYEVRNHPILDVLDNPDGHHFFSRRALLGLMVSSMDLLGSGYLVPDGRGWDYRTGKVGSGPPEFLWIMYAQYVLTVRDTGDPLPRWWQYFAERIPVESALWFRQSISLRDPYGSAYPPAYAGDMYADQEQRMVAIADQLLGEGPRPNAVVSSKDPMMPMGLDAKKRLDQDLNRRHSGGRAGGVLVTDGSIEVTPINQPPADKSWRDLSEYDRDCLASLFGVPPTFFTTDTNLANLQAADEQHSRMAVEPRCCAIAEVLTDLVRRWDPRLFFRFDPAIQEDDEAREKVISMQLASGRVVINEVNEEDRWPLKEWGNEPWLPGTMKQPSMIMAEHEQGLETAKAGIEQGAQKAENESKMTEFQTSEEPAGSEEERALWRRLERLRREMMGGAA